MKTAGCGGRLSPSCATLPLEGRYQAAATTKAWEYSRPRRDRCCDSPTPTIIGAFLLSSILTPVICVRVGTLFMYTVTSGQSRFLSLAAHAAVRIGIWRRRTGRVFFVLAMVLVEGLGFFCLRGAFFFIYINYLPLAPPAVGPSCRRGLIPRFHRPTARDSRRWLYSVNRAEVD